MKKRVALLGIYHESNTFSSRPTLYEDFENSHLLIGSAIFEEYRDAYHEIGGMIAGINDDEIELVPVYFAEATPGGAITSEAYQRLKNEMLKCFQEVLPVDGVLVVVHGAGVSEDYLDMDGHWLRKIREIVGSSIPIIGTLDPHGNVSQLMVDSTDALIAYSTNPHIDQRQTGILAGELMRKVLIEKFVVNQLFVDLPLAISIEQQYTSKEPCLSLYNLVQKVRDEEDLLHISILLGFPYADVKEMGTSLIIIVSNGNEKAQDAGNQIKEYVLKNREDFIGSKNDINDVLEKFDRYLKPILLLDIGDNIGGGSSGDSTYILDAMEEREISNSCICICNSAAVSLASKYTIGDSFSILLKSVNQYNRREEYQVQLIAKKDGRFQELNPRHGGQVNFDMGNVVILKTALGNTILLSSLRVPPFSSQQITAFGLKAEAFDFIIAKGVNAPIAAYESICPTIVQVNTPGETQADMTQFSYKNRRKPLFPFENE